MANLPVIPLSHPTKPEDVARLGQDYVSLYSYWLKLRGHGPEAPAWRSFDPIDMPLHLSRLWVIEAHEAPFRLRYRLAGTLIVASYGRDPTGLWFDEFWPHLAGQADYGKRYRDTIADGRPSFRRGPPRMMVQREWGLIENLFLPFRHPGCLGLVVGYSHLYDVEGRLIY